MKTVTIAAGFIVLSRTERYICLYWLIAIIGCYTLAASPIMKVKQRADPLKPNK
jgi:hypothetical protein